MADQQRAHREPLASELLTSTQQSHQLYQQPEPMEEEEDEDDDDNDEEGSVAGEEATYGEKRRYSEMQQCESDEDDFAGFDEDAASSENGMLNSPRHLGYLSDAILHASGRKFAKSSSVADEDADPECHNSTAQEDTENGNAIGNDSAKSLLKKKINVQINTQDDVFKAPFKYGWKRELVYRANMEMNSKDKGEVYYITPQGKKLRTRNDIAALLHDDLTINNFTFAKEPVGGKPDEETIRIAKSYSSFPKRSGLGNYVNSLPDTSPDLGKRIPKPKMPKGASPPPPSSYARATSLGTHSKASGLNAQISPKGSQSNASLHAATAKSNDSAGTLGKQTKAAGKIKAESCTIQCLPAMGMIPILQCMVCYCMYHPECVNATTAEALARRFTCKTCIEDSVTAKAQQQQQQQPQPQPQPLPQPPETYKESFGKFGASGNGHGSGSPDPAPKPPLSASSNGGGADTITSQMPPPVVAKEKSKRSTQQQSTAAKTAAAVAPASLVPASSANVGKEIPPQDVLVIGNHEYVVVPKGKAAAVKSKKASTKTGNTSQPQIISKLPDEARKLNNNSVGSKDSGAGTHERLSDDESAEPGMSGTADGWQRNNSISSGKSGTRHSGTAAVPHYNNSARDPSNFLAEVSAGYDSLMHIFDYLKVQELLRASSVCRMWNHVGNHPRFWKTVRMKNSYVKDWAGMIAKLRKNDTRHLDLRKVLNAGSNDEMWQSFIEHIGQADKIDTIDLCRCSSTVVGSLLQSNPNLRVVNALAIKNDPIDFYNFEHGVNLEELRLKSSAAVSLDGDLQQLGALRQLRHLSLTSIAKLGATSIEALGSLTLLESLELGECTEIGLNLATILPSLTNLKRLRLEKGQENFDMFTVLQGISTVASLTQLELINCDVKLGFDKHFAACTNLRKLLLIPTYVSQSAATNRMVLKGLLKLHQTLETVVWAITVELLRVTELYIDANVEDAQSQFGGSIPILKPVPGSDEPAKLASASSQPDLPEEVEIVPLKKVQSILDRRVPNTKVQILKIPFGNTWKQTMGDFV